MKKKHQFGEHKCLKGLENYIWVPFWWFLTPFYTTFPLTFSFCHWWIPFHFYAFQTEILIFEELLIVWNQNQCPWIWHTLNPKYAPLKPFWCIFCSQNQQNVKLKNINLKSEKLFEKAWKYRFLGVPITMHYVIILCYKYFPSYDSFSSFLRGRFRHRVLKHGVGVEWDPRSSAT